MWSLYYPCLMVLLAFPITMADLTEDMKECVEIVDIEDLEKVMELPDSEELSIFCPVMLGFFECLEDAVRKETGFSMEELRFFVQGTRIESFFSVYMNTRRLIRDLCDTGSQIHKDYQQHSACYRNVTKTGYPEVCSEQAEEIFDGLKSLEDQMQEEPEDNEQEQTGEDEMQEETGDDQIQEEYGEDTMQEDAGEDQMQEEDKDTTEHTRQCIVEAFKAACTGIEIHKECGQSAFDLYMEIVRRTTLFSNGLCTADQLKDAKIHFMETLDPDTDSPLKELYESAFDMKKRRK